MSSSKYHRIDTFPSVESLSCCDTFFVDDSNQSSSNEDTNDRPIEGKSTLLQGTFNMTKAIVGAGVFSVPYAVQHAGLLTVILLTILLGVIVSQTNTRYTGHSRYYSKLDLSARSIHTTSSCTAALEDMEVCSMHYSPSYSLGDACWHSL
jgi:Transmembrane amino acid transporter protein